MSDKHLVREPALVPAAQMYPRLSAFHSIFFFKSGNQISEFLLGEH